ncbi:MAG: TetR/AcrR family transcriptional regulator [Moraxella sp.]|nr:TetR/AcrR family transcriptional regulator [Moraxella sp.]
MKTDKQQQIVQACYQLFYRQGFHACGVELLAKHAGITKRTLYRYFASKDELIAAVLAYRHQDFISQLQTTLDGFDNTQTIEGYLAFLAHWIHSADFFGCLFINACAEYADHANSLHQQAKAHKQAVHQILLYRFQQSDLLNQKQACTLADLLFVSGEGLIVSAQTHGTQYIEPHFAIIRQSMNAQLARFLAHDFLAHE